MLALAFLTIAAVTEHDQTAPAGSIPLTRNEIARLATTLISPSAPLTAHQLSWSQWRRRHQHRGSEHAITSGSPWKTCEHAIHDSQPAPGLALRHGDLSICGVWRQTAHYCCVPESSDRVVLPDDVERALGAHAGIQRIELTGSRASGRATPQSDWDFVVVTAHFTEVRDAMARLVVPLRPVIAQWDRLSRTWCYMLPGLSR